MSVYSNFKHTKKYGYSRVNKIFLPVHNNLVLAAGVFITAVLISALSFIFLYWCLSLFNINYAIKTLIVFVISNALVFLIDLSNEFKRRLRKASRPLLILCLLISLIIGFGKYGGGKFDKYLRDPNYKANSH